MGLLGKKTSLGLDVGTSSLKLVEIEPKKDKGVVLKNYAELKAVTGNTEKATATTKETENFINMSSVHLRQLIQHLLAQLKSRSRNLYISLPIYVTFTKIIEIVSVEKKELEQVVRFEAQKHIPAPLQEMILEWRVVQGVRTQQGKTPVFLLAVPKDLVEKYRQLAEDLRLNLNVLEVEIFSLARLVDVGPSEAFILFDVGGRNTNITLFSGGFIVKTYNFPVSGEGFSRRIAQSSGISLADAERIKREVGLKDEQTRHAIEPFLRNVIEKIQKIFEEHKNINKIVITGGSAQMPGLIDFLRSSLSQISFKGEVSLVNPWKYVEAPTLPDGIKKKLSATYAVAIGLTLHN